MELPILLPAELDYAGKAKDQRELFQVLTKNPSDLVLFFEYAADNETWSEKHLEFMQLAIEWLTERFFEDRILTEFGRRAAHAIQEHYSLLGPLMPLDLSAAFDSTYEKINSLMWGSSSEWIHSLIKSECVEKNETELPLGSVEPEHFYQISEYINTGKVQNLWRKEQEEIMPLLLQATEWGLMGLVTQCEDILKKYITKGNAIDLLIQSHEQEWLSLRQACIDLINRMDAGVSLQSLSPDYFSFEFLTYSPEALQIFEDLRFHITHLICGFTLIEVPTFSDVINRCPKLISLDISRTNAYSERLLDIPAELAELNVSKCPWLNTKTMRQLFEICPNLLKLTLGSNSHLDYSCWGLLKHLKLLVKLDLSRCHQINDQDFKIILQACNDVTHFSLQGCINLTDASFFEMAKQVPKLVELDVSRCNIYDGALVDISMRCKQLAFLNLTRATTLTEKGLLEAVRNLSNLTVLDLTACKFSPESITQIKEMKPYLNVIN